MKSDLALISLIIILMIVIFSIKGKSQEFTLSSSGIYYIYPIMSDSTNGNTVDKKDHQTDSYHLYTKYYR